MLTLLAAISVALGCAGTLYAVLIRRGLPRSSGDSPDRQALRSIAGPMIVGLLVLFAATLPAVKPFAEGRTLGWGFLIGGVIAFLTLFLFSPTSGESEDPALLAWRTGVLSLASMGPSAALLLFHGYPNEALMGCGLGSLFIGIMASGVYRTLHASMDGGDLRSLQRSRQIELHALSTTMMAVGARLAIEHFPRSMPSALAGGYWAMPMLLLTSGCFILTLIPETSRLPAFQKQIFPAVIAGLGMVGIAAAIQVRLLPSLAWPIELYGLLAFGFIYLLFDAQDSHSEEHRDLTLVLSLGAGLLALSVVAVSFRELQGYGQAMALLPGLVLVTLTSLSRKRESLSVAVLTGTLTVALLITVQRVFLERAGRGVTLDFQQFYNLLSLVFGTFSLFGVYPLTSAALKRRPQTMRIDPHYTRGSLLRIVEIGAAFAIVPLILAALWGPKATGAYLAGLLLSELMWVALASWLRGNDQKTVLLASPHLLLIASAMMAAQFTPLVLSLALTRPQKLILSGVTAGIALFIVLLHARLSSVKGNSVESSV